MIDIEKVKQAVQYTEEGKYREAEEIYYSLLEKNPHESALLSAFGLFYVNTGNYNKAVEYLRQACEIKETLGTVASLGFAEYERKNYAEASRILEHALSFGENPDIYNKLILSLFECRDYKKAIEYTEKMCKLYPDNPKSIANKVKSLTQSGKLIEAERVCVEYLRKNQNNGALWYHLGLLKELIYSDDKSAIECYKIAGKNGNLNSDYNIAVSYQKLGEFEEAEKYYKEFLQIMPDNNTAITSLGICYLTQKKFKEGYELYYKREKGKTKNLWKEGTPVDKELIVTSEQGFGDRIQFIRYIPFISKDRNVKVAECSELKKLFEKNYPDIEFIDYNEINPNTQIIRMTDLPYVLNMDFDNIPYANGYLDAEPSDIKNNKLKVGLCWEAGASGVRGMINRTIHVKCFEPFFNMENIQTYSFQYNDTFMGNEKYPQMINLAKDFKNFYDTASAIKSMDAIVTVDTVIAHLSGALGVKTYLLLPYAPDWRWFNNDKKTEWYKSVEIFRQKNPMSWQEEIEQIINLLKTKS